MASIREYLGFLKGQLGGCFQLPFWASFSMDFGQFFYVLCRSREIPPNKDHEARIYMTQRVQSTQDLRSLVLQTIPLMVFCNQKSQILVLGPFGYHVAYTISYYTILYSTILYYIPYYIIYHTILLGSLVGAGFGPCCRHCGIQVATHRAGALRTGKKTTLPSATKTHDFCQVTYDFYTGL